MTLLIQILIYISMYYLSIYHISIIMCKKVQKVSIYFVETNRVNRF